MAEYRRVVFAVIVCALALLQGAPASAQANLLDVANQTPYKIGATVEFFHPKAYVRKWTYLEGALGIPSMWPEEKQVRMYATCLGSDNKKHVIFDGLLPLTQPLAREEPTLSGYMTNVFTFEEGAITFRNFTRYKLRRDEIAYRVDWTAHPNCAK